MENGVCTLCMELNKLIYSNLAGRRVETIAAYIFQNEITYVRIYTEKKRKVSVTIINNRLASTNPPISVWTRFSLAFY